ncbi:unnamed protein product [Prunus armeniaca]
MPSSKYILITMLPQALLLVTLLNINVASASNIIKTLPGFRGDLPFKLETGYVGVGGMDDVQLFYYFFESEGSPEYDPLVLWLTGGPGCSAFSAFVYENLGPLSFDYAHSIGNKPKLKLNPYSWTKVANIIFLDAPVGTGFSYAKNWEGYSNLNDTLSAAQTYEFLRKWLMDHPKFYSNPLYIAGDSYSGITVPMLVQEISDGNQDEHVPPMNLKGYVLGNPGTDEKKDNNYKVLFAYLKALISDELYQSMKKNCKGEYINVDLNNTLCLEDLQLYNECIEDIWSVQILEPSCTLVASPKSARSKWNVNYFSDKDSVNLLLSFPQLPRPWCRSYNYLFSYIWANDKTVQDALHIQEWLSTHRKFLANPLYISGDSYSGKIVPIIVQEIVNGIEAGTEPPLNLKGYVIGDPVTNEKEDLNSRIEFAHRMALISNRMYESTKKNCKGEYVDVDPNNQLCLNNLQSFKECTSRLDDSHILAPACVPRINHNEQTTFGADRLRYSVVWANDMKVRKALNIREGTKGEWVRCNRTTPYIKDVQRAVEYHRNLSQKSLRAFVYSGDHDLSVPYVSTEAWIESLSLPIDDDWKPWFSNNQVAGYTVRYSNGEYHLTYATIKGGGHTAPEFNPRECFDMIKRWLEHSPL